MNTFPMSLLLLGLLVVIALVLLLRRRRAERDPPPPSPYARDDAFGRPDPAWGGGYPQQPGVPPPAGGLGSSVAGGLAAGLAMGAGAVVAQEIGRRILEQGHEGHDGLGTHDPYPPSHGSARDSQLARDAGIGAIDPSADPQGLGDFGDAGWDDAGAAGDDGSWDS